MLAHGGAGGSTGEALILALPLLVLGVVLFVQKTVKPVVSLSLVAAGVAVVVGGMTVFADDDHDAEASVSGDGGSYVSLVTGLCEARRVASVEPEERERLFTDEVHVPLHDLAAAVEEEDRAAAATLLEMKQAVESDLAGEPVEGETLEAHLDELLEATIAGLAAIDVAAPTC